MTKRTKVEFIESYWKDGNTDYIWNDNHGELIRCRDCAFWQDDWSLCSAEPDWHYCSMNDANFRADEYCSRGERKEVEE